MCGIAGILRLTPPGDAARAAIERTPFDAIPEGWLDLLDESIRHRGPDGQGRFRDRAVRPDGTVVDVALVHRRLSIIDHGGGAQPMVSQLLSQRGPGASLSSTPAIAFQPLLFHGKPNDPVRYEPLPDHPDTLAVVFNGCIYNHRELRAELQAAGRRFKTDHSDTEVLLHGVREWGPMVSGELEAMFAFGVWNRIDALLHLACDTVGEKPLYTTSTMSGLVSGVQAPCTFAFCSVPAGLLRLREIWDDVVPLTHAGALEEWIGFGYGRDVPLAMEGPRRLGSPMTVPGESSADGQHEPRRDEGNRAAAGRRVNAFTESQVDAAVAASVSSRVEADVPLGCFLSGGVDSSLVAFHATRVRAELRTFTVRMPDARYDESSFAEEVAKHIGASHSTLDIAAEPAADLVALIQQVGLPFGDSSLLPACWVARAAKREVAVVLTGDGGDEVFAGYERHALDWNKLVWASRAARLVPRRVLRAAGPRSRLGRLARAADATDWRTRDIGRIFCVSDLERLFAPGGVCPYFLEGPLEYFGNLSSLERDFFSYLPDDLLRKTDSATMSVALEGRAPLLSSELVRMGLTSTLSSLMPGGQRKGLLRAVARRHLPAHIVDRPKMGFAIPIGEWFRSDYGGLRTLLLDHLNSAEPFGPPSLGIDLNMAYVRQMLDEHLGTGHSGLVKRDHSQRLYMLLVLSIWAKWLGSLRA